MGYEFGDSTSSLREQLLLQEENNRSSSLVTDDLKNHFQFSIADVISHEEVLNEDGKAIGKRYKVFLIRERFGILAIHKEDQVFWSRGAFPKPGDRVRIKHRKDFFQAEIIEILTVTYADAVAKYGTIVKKAG